MSDLSRLQRDPAPAQNMTGFQPAGAASTLSPNSSEAPIWITLDSPSATKSWFTCGDEITGTVSARKFVKPRRLWISLRCRSTCRIGSRDSVVAKVNILSCTQELLSRYEEHGPLRDGHICIPFSVCVPDTVEGAPETDKGLPFNPSQDFEHQSGHLLPPSLNIKDGKVKIDYYLEAALDASYPALIKGKTFQYPLTVFPSTTHGPVSTPLAPCDPIAPYRRTQVQDDSGSRMSRLKNRLQGADKTEEPFAFRITANLPSVMHVGELLPATLSLKYLGRTDEGMVAPPISLRGLRCQMNVSILCRVPLPGDRKESSYMYFHKFDLFGLPLKGMNMFDGMPLSSLGRIVEIGKHVPPTFQTYNVSLKYNINLTLWVECLGKVHNVEIGRKNITILPMLASRSGITEPPPTFVDDAGEYHASTATHGAMDTIVQPENLASSEPPPPYAP